MEGPMFKEDQRTIKEGKPQGKHQVLEPFRVVRKPIE
jgi:hypothetical protein